MVLYSAPVWGFIFKQAILTILNKCSFWHECDNFPFLSLTTQSLWFYSWGGFLQNNSMSTIHNFLVSVEDMGNSENFYNSWPRLCLTLT